MDSRIRNLARILTHHSARVQEGDVVGLNGPSAAEPLLAAVHEEVLRAGGNPLVTVSFEGQDAAFFRHASPQQLDWVSPTAEWQMRHADCLIRVMGDVNTRALSRVPAERQVRRQTAMKPLRSEMLRRAAAGELRWVVTMFPTHGYAAEAETDLASFEDFYYAACLAGESDPVAAWEAASQETRRLCDWIQGREEVHITGPGTDLRLSIAGRSFIAAGGEHNMPDGEFFTGPVEDSAEGEISFHLPTAYGGREVAGVRMRFHGGRVVEASAERGEDFLISTLDTDEGARRLGELGIGTNFGIEQGTKEILLDEKIGGTVHLAVGASYPETGGRNDSAVHWDMICDLRRGGRIVVDGETLQEDGRFVV